MPYILAGKTDLKLRASYLFTHASNISHHRKDAKDHTCDISVESQRPSRMKTCLLPLTFNHAISNCPLPRLVPLPCQPTYSGSQPNPNTRSITSTYTLPSTAPHRTSSLTARTFPSYERRLQHNAPGPLSSGDTNATRSCCLYKVGRIREKLASMGGKRCVWLILGLVGDMGT